MTRIAKAVVCRDTSKPVEVENIYVDPPAQGEITIKLAACGVCHSDLSATNGTTEAILPPPIVLGHEGAGTVVEVGAGVTSFKPGDHVLSMFVHMCGECGPCSRGRPVLCERSLDAVTTLPDGTCRTRGSDGKPLNVFCGVGVMAEYATIHAKNAIKIEEDLSFASASLVSCAVMTGVGAVTNSANLAFGDDVAVFGVGGVGLNALQGARLAGANRIIAVDVNPEKLALAREFGATDTINANEQRPADVIQSFGGVDYAFECVGSGKLAEQAYRALARGGELIIVGLAPGTDEVCLSPTATAVNETGVKGSYYGSARPQHDIPKLLSLYRDGRLKLDELITQTYTIDEAPQALDDLDSGRNARGVILFE